MKKIKYQDSYPVQRAMQLIEAVARDLTNQLLKVLSNFQIMYLEYEEFKK